MPFDYRDTHIDAISKATYLIIGTLIDALNATRSIAFVPAWHYKHPKTGQMAGMLGDLLNHTAHVGGSALFFTAERVHLLDYISMTTSTFAAFVFRTPSLSYTSNIYYLPLSATVWVCSILLVILSTFVIYAAYKHSPNSNTSRNFHTDYMRISDFVLIALSTVCQMGSQLYPKRISGRISTVSFCDLKTFIQPSKYY